MSKKIIRSIIKATLKSKEEKNHDDDINVKKNYENVSIISTGLKSKNLYQKIELSWETKTLLIVSIGEDIVVNGEYFEIDPRNSSSIEEFIEKIEELLFINVILQRNSSGTVEFNNGIQLVQVKYHNALEKKALGMLSLKLKEQHLL